MSGSVEAAFCGDAVAVSCAPVMALLLRFVLLCILHFVHGVSDGVCMHGKIGE